MSRLTKLDKYDGGYWVKDKYGEDRWFSPKGKLYKPIEKLAHYEDLEEQGRLIVQKRGRWIEICNGKVCVCSECDEKYDHTYDWCCEWNYCPNCGAKMDEVE